MVRKFYGQGMGRTALGKKSSISCLRPVNANQQKKNQTKQNKPCMMAAEISLYSRFMYLRSYS